MYRMSVFRGNSLHNLFSPLCFSQNIPPPFTLRVLAFVVEGSIMLKIETSLRGEMSMGFTMSRVMLVIGAEGCVYVQREKIPP